MALETLSTMVIKGSGALIGKLIADYAKRSLDHNPLKLKSIKENITPHIEATFNKCSTIKTLLNPHSPANFLQIYAIQRFWFRGRTLDHFDMVEAIRENSKHTIITGSGGSGKSMFTRYLWLSLFVHSNGKIPLFLELRNTNSITSDNILAYIRNNISQGSASMGEDDYNRHLRNGDFVLILDGFDEVSHQRRESIQSQIMNLAENYPSVDIVVTSRPDVRFESWSMFHVVKILPLTKADALSLLRRIEFEENAKMRFVKKLQSEGLFEKHETFLSNPLLASMMLLTFSHNFDIPDKMHLFYQQAFDALYERHDSYKPGGYKREFHTKTKEDVFKRILSYFCLLSYYDQVFSFDRETALLYIRNAIKIEGVDIGPGDFLQDLCEAVCFLVVDGLEYIFSHRSFQEYFAAYCISYVTTKKFDELIGAFSKRHNDQVVLLISDMNPELLRRHYILPKSSEYEEQLQIGRRSKSVEKFYRASGTRFQLRLVPPEARPRSNKKAFRLDETFVSLHGEGDINDFVSLVCRLSPEGYPDDPILAGSDAIASMKARDERDSRAVKGILAWMGAAQSQSVVVFSDDHDFIFKITDVAIDGIKYKGERIEGTKNEKLSLIFRESYMYEWIARRMKMVDTYVRQQRSIDKNAASSMDMFINTR